MDLFVNPTEENHLRLRKVHQDLMTTSADYLKRIQNKHRFEKGCLNSIGRPKRSIR